MSTIFVKFPPTAQTAANAYCNECNLRYAELVSEPGGLWYIPRQDKNSNWTIALYGPPWSWDGINVVPEPSSCAALRTEAVVVETPEWPPAEE